MLLLPLLLLRNTEYQCVCYFFSMRSPFSIVSATCRSGSGSGRAGSLVARTEALVRVTWSRGRELRAMRRRRVVQIGDSSRPGRGRVASIAIQERAVALATLAPVCVTERQRQKNLSLRVEWSTSMTVCIKIIFKHTVCYK